MNDDEFWADLVRSSPPAFSTGSLRAAVRELGDDTVYSPGVVSTCVVRAGEIEAANSAEMTRSRPTAIRGTHVTTISLRTWLQRWAEEQRLALFGSKDRPFANSKAAAQWIKCDMPAGKRTSEVKRAQERWREVHKAVRQFHQCGLGWASLAAESRVIEFERKRKPLLRIIFPNAGSAVIAFERSLSEIHKRTGIWRSALTKFVLTGRLQNSAFQRIGWGLSVHTATSDAPQVALVGTLTIHIADLPRAELRQAFDELNEAWKALQTRSGNALGRAIFSEQVGKLLSSVDALGGPPARKQAEFWKRVALRVGYRTGEAAKVAYWRATRKARIGRIAVRR